MLLGKRPRPPIKRTTSMTGITVDTTIFESTTDPSIDHHIIQNYPHETQDQNLSFDADGYDHRFLATMVSPRIRRSSNDFLETATFLRTCGLCNRHLAPGRDIYMYRGDTAFCSLECREEQMKQDERKEKYSKSGTSAVAAASKNKEESHASSRGSKAESESVAAA